MKDIKAYILKDYSLLSTAKFVNFMIRNNIKHLNMNDLKYYGFEISDQTRINFELCDCDVVKVHDLFNVTLPNKTLTKEEINRITFFERLI